MKLNFSQPDPLKAFTFDGEARIEIRNVRETDHITLHAKNLTIISYSLALQSGLVTGVTKDFEDNYNSTTDIWKLPLNVNMSQVDTFFLTVNYKGLIGTEMSGFYRSYYKENNNKVWMGTTQFQQTDARRAFPCFDVRLT